MSWLSNMFSGLGRFFRNLFPVAREFAVAVGDVLTKVMPYVVKIYPIVERVAELTPTRSDDEILALVKQYKLNFIKSTPKDFMLREIAKAIFRHEVPEDANVQNYVLNLAVEIAYSKLRNKLNLVQ